MDIKLLPFFHYHLGIHKFFITKNGIKLTTDLINENLFSINNDNQQITNVLIEQKNLSELILQNGNNIICNENNYIYELQKGWIRVKDIKIGDKILNKINIFDKNNLYENKNSKINFNNSINGKRMPVVVPEYMNNKFAEWLGIITTNGIIKDDHEIAVFLDTKEKIDYYIKLTKEAINITPLLKEDKRSDTRAKIVFFYSINIANYLKTFIGEKLLVRRIPSSIFHSSFDEQLSFLKGLCFSSYKERNSVVAYGGHSKPISEFIALMFRYAGYQVSVQHKKKSANLSYIIRIIGSYKGKIDFFFFNDDCNFIQGKYATDLILFKNKWVQYKTLAFKKYKLHEFSLEYIWIPVKKINQLGSKDSISIKVNNKDGINYNQVLISGTI